MSTFNSSSGSLAELETLFIEKLQEKYNLNLRDLKRCFSRFDLDGNGLLDLDEMTQGVQIFLNGVAPELVRKLVDKYDRNGDGKISYEEFLHFLQTRTAIEEDGEDAYGPGRAAVDGAVDSNLRQHLRGDDYGYGNDDYGDDYAGGGYDNENDVDYYDDNLPPPPQQRQQQQRGGSRGGSGSGGRRNAPFRPPTAASEAESDNLDATDPLLLEQRAKIFLSNLKNHLLEAARKLRMQGKLKLPTTKHLNALLETVARQLLSKRFQQFTGQQDGRSREPQVVGVEAPDFSRVVRSFKFPGVSPVRNETVMFLFELCSTSIEGTAFQNEEGRVVADCAVLADLLFGAPVAAEDRKARGLNPLGWKEQSNNQRDQHGFEIKGFVDRVVHDREAVKYGPVVLPQAVDSKAQQLLLDGSREAEALAVPLRFVSRKSRSALVVPSTFDPARDIPRSNQLPEYELVRKHVFGMCGALYSNSPIHALANTPSAFRQQQQQQQSSSSLRSSPDFIDSAALVYSAGGLGVVHDLATNSQLFFDGHEDDITCLTVSPDGTYAATGQMGREPRIYVWPTDLKTRADSKKCIADIGAGFFSRGVCALSISWDSRYIVGVGCDDMHMMGVFELLSGQLMEKASCQHGIPPQIKWIAYCPAQQHTEFITREHAGPCDMFATAGANHLKLWSFRRPSGSEPASLQYLAATVRKGGHTAPKVYNCCAFIVCDDKSYDFAAGGSSGMAFLWRRGALCAAQQLFRGAVTAMEICVDKLYCGGAGGGLKVLDARTLTVLQSFALLQSPPPAANAGIASKKTKSCAPSSSSGIGSSSSSSGRPRSASAGPAAARLAHRQTTAATRARAPLSAPKQHAAGQRRTSQDDGAATIRGAGYGVEVSPAEAKATSASLAAAEDTGERTVTGICVVRQQQGRSQGPAQYVIAALGTGKVVRVDVNSSSNSGSSSTGARPSSSNSSRGGSGGGVQLSGRDLFHFHTGSTWGLSAEESNACRLFASTCDDRKLMVWDAQDCVLIAKAALSAPAHCCSIDKSNRFIACGTTSGALLVHYLSDELLPGSKFYKLTEVAYRKDASQECSDVKFSPSNTMLALGTHDTCIYVYGCELAQQETGHGRSIGALGVCVLKALHRLRGHTSYITHLDWSYDSRLIQTTCGAYELICWDVESGRQCQTINVSDVRWKTHSCVLGFSVMGIWPPYSDGTDINAVDVNATRGICVTGGDDGRVRLANFPCVVKHAPNREYTGHSSHVMGVQLMRDGQLLVTAGGHDETVMVYEVRPLQALAAADSFQKAGARSRTGNYGSNGTQQQSFARTRPQSSARPRIAYEPSLG